MRFSLSGKMHFTFQIAHSAEMCEKRCVWPCGTLMMSELVSSDGHLPERAGQRALAWSVDKSKTDISGFGL